MLQKDKKLLLKDLCARLPYKVKVKYYSMDYPYGSEPVILTPYLLYDRWENIREVEPYLRPMSSMTEEEKNEYFGRTMTIDIVETSQQVIDWLLKHHFDYRNLIEKGLALEAPANMYKTE